VVEGTCDEIGRLASWVTLERSVSLEEPVSLTISLRLQGLVRPSEVAARLPKALIHHNVPGTPIHGFLVALDEAWTQAAPWQDFGARQRWIRSVETVKAAGYKVHDGDSRWRLGEITVDWGDVAP
jgi:hypothetical protein